MDRGTGALSNAVYTSNKKNSEDNKKGKSKEWKKVIDGNKNEGEFTKGNDQNHSKMSISDGLGLSMLSSTSQVKVVKFVAKPIRGVAEATLRIGSWQETCSMTVVPMDDFNLILGIEFFSKAKVILMPGLWGFVIEDRESLCYIQAEKEGIQTINKGK
ncbi:hypothetical protein Ddye_021259 [Dipteronia dyeriana]|uniref:Uncharacterized protein n=1 Tax=Dipteronia dyeriana TaxID=168575 RepID=A0AAD9WW51_9ROSI|nr:hypothetical protein Ddye_021259 [Dipteronia dyeriana]